MSERVTPANWAEAETPPRFWLAHIERLHAATAESRFGVGVVDADTGDVYPFGPYMDAARDACALLNAAPEQARAYVRVSTRYYGIVAPYTEPSPLPGTLAAEVAHLAAALAEVRASIDARLAPAVRALGKALSALDWHTEGVRYTLGAWVRRVRDRVVAWLARTESALTEWRARRVCAYCQRAREWADDCRCEVCLRCDVHRPHS